MSIGILVGKIAALFIIMFLGFVLVKTGICRSDDSRILSRLSVYIVVPCSILSAFQVSCSPSILNGLLLAVAAAVLIHLILIVLFYFIGKTASGALLKKRNRPKCCMKWAVIWLRDTILESRCQWKSSSGK